MTAAAIPMATADHWEPNCPHGPAHGHTYGVGGSAGTKSDTAVGNNSVGVTTVTETNHIDCDGDFDPTDANGDNETGETADFDGDYESGVGGGFFGYGPWAHEPTCDYGLTSHGAIVTVNDIVFGNDIWFVIGADDTSGPAFEVDPVDGSISCSTDGSITPGDPATDPTADADDCLTAPQNKAKGIIIPACGAGGDGGYWVFLGGALVQLDDGGTTGPSNAPTAGTLTA